MDLYNGSDQVLLLEIALRGELKQVDRELFFRREHPDASTLRRNWTAKERAKFQYADDQRALVFPYCRLLKEHLACIRNSSLSSRDKIRCAGAVLKRFRPHWRDIAGEVIRTPLNGLRVKQSVAPSTSHQQ